MQMAATDLSDVVTLRKRVGHAASSIKGMGVLVAAFIAVAWMSAIGLWSLLLALCLGWGIFQLANRLKSGGAVAVNLSTALVGLYGLATLFFLLPDMWKHDITFTSLTGFVLLLALLFFSVKGLLALRAYRNRPPQAKRSGGSLGASPLENESRAAHARPRFLSKSSLAAYFFVLMAPMVWLVMFLVAREGQGGRVPQSAGEAIGERTAQLLIGLGVWVMMVKLYRRGRRHAMLPGSSLLKVDARPPVLYLRSFQDDDAIKVWARNTDGRILPERLVKITFEELVTDHLWCYGPVLAIGDPREKGKLAALGAARDFAQDDEWQRKATQMMQQASMIVMVLGRSDGVIWEVNRIVELGLTRKLLLLFPPIAPSELASRWQALTQRARGFDLSIRPDFEHTRAVLWPTGQCTTFTAVSRDDWTFETVLDAAAVSIKAA